MKVATSAANLPIDEPTLLRRRKFAAASMMALHPLIMLLWRTTEEDHLGVIYFNALDLITACIDERCNQPGYKTYANIEALLLKAAAKQPYEEELQFVLSFCGSDFVAMLVPKHLEIFSRNFQAEQEVVVSDMITFFRSCTPG